MLNLSLSELVLTCVIFGFVMAAGRVGKLGAAIGNALAGRPSRAGVEPELGDGED